MPWNQTEELFKSTLKAANQSVVGNEAEAVKGPKIIDLGEAGSQEVWQNGAYSISKTIVKHGGTYSFPPSAKTLAPYALGRGSGVSQT